MMELGTLGFRLALKRRIWDIGGGAWSVREDTQVVCMCFYSRLYWIILTGIGWARDNQSIQESLLIQEWRLSRYQSLAVLSGI